MTLKGQGHDHDTLEPYDLKICWGGRALVPQQQLQEITYGELNVNVHMIDVVT